MFTVICPNCKHTFKVMRPKEIRDLYKGKTIEYYCEFCKRWYKIDIENFKEREK